MRSTFVVRALLAAVASGWAAGALAQFDILRDPSTQARYTVNGGEVPPGHSSNPEGFLGPGSFSSYGSGAGPQIGTEITAEFTFPVPAKIQQLSLAAYAWQHSRSETNFGTSAYLRVDRRLLDDTWVQTFFDGYENNYEDGERTDDRRWTLPNVLGFDPDELLSGVRMILSSRGYANSPPGIPFVEVLAQLDDAASIAVVPEPSSWALMAGSIMIGCVCWLPKRRRRDCFAR